MLWISCSTLLSLSVYLSIRGALLLILCLCSVIARCSPYHCMYCMDDGQQSAGKGFFADDAFDLQDFSIIYFGGKIFYLTGTIPALLLPRFLSTSEDSHLSSQGYFLLTNFCLCLRRHHREMMIMMAHCSMSMMRCCHRLPTTVTLGLPPISYCCSMTAGRGPLSRE